MLLHPKMYLDAYCTTNVLETFAESPGINYHHVDVAVLVLGLSVLCRLLFLVLSLLGDHMGYLHQIKAFRISCSSFCSS